MFLFCGVNPFSSSMALMVAKLLTVFVTFHLGKTMINARIGAIGALIYVFSPTILYYTTVFYKETVVQLLTAIILLSVFKVFLNPGGVRYWMLLFLSLAAILNERFYMFFFYIAAFIPLVIIRKKFANKTQGIIAFVLLVLVGFAIGQQAYELLVKGDTTPVIDIFKNYRRWFLRYPDVSPLNWTLPYPLLAVKILFTPYFTLNKFTLFSDYGYILIWASFFNQAVILFSLYGMFGALRISFERNWFLILPFVFFIGLYAYLAPYSGRLRDGFYPIIVVYAAYAATSVYCAWRMRRSGSKVPVVFGNYD